VLRDFDGSKTIYPTELPLRELIDTAETEDLDTVVGKIYAKTNETDHHGRVIYAVRKKPAPVSDLAIVLKRDRTAVKRDVKILTLLGLLTIHEETNPGHGRRKIVEPLASKYELVATI
jgi:DNA-binding MarR family transcriptional regulator